MHPRASEVTVCLDGVLLVGFVDTSGRVFTQELHPGEAFVFPKGMIHFLYNIDTVSSALAVSGLTSQNPGTQILSLLPFTKSPTPEETRMLLGSTKILEAKLLKLYDQSITIQMYMTNVKLHKSY